ncbi:MAG TPA: hypothetical protein DEA08_26115 [Planctomycetes bacterium]|nr:hypothetical protein [Planctomycetota bacterium]
MDFVSAGDFTRVPGEAGVALPAAEPTPFGRGVLEELYLPDPSLLKEGFAPDEMLVIGGNSFGYPLCMSLAQGDRGAIYYFDLQQRAGWSDAQFRSMFSALSPDLVTGYLEPRQRGELPEKPERLLHYYRIADDFSEFLTRCEPLA